MAGDQRTGEYIHAQATAAYQALALTEDHVWPYALNTRSAGVVVAALRAYSDMPGGAAQIADRLHAEQQRHIRATLGLPCR